MIGALHWVIKLGRFDVMSATVKMAKFRMEPRVGHLKFIKNMYGYLMRTKDGAIRYRTGEPDYTYLPENRFEWLHTVYGNIRELLPRDCPEPLGKTVVLTHYVDANLYHDFTTGRALTGVLHLLNGTPIDWFSKCQATVETATYGSEFVADRITTDHIIDICTTLSYLGVKVDKPSYLFGDNQSVITRSTIIYSSLNNWYNDLSYYCVHEAISSDIINLYHIYGKNNPVNLLSIHSGYKQSFP